MKNFFLRSGGLPFLNRFAFPKTHDPRIICNAGGRGVPCFPAARLPRSFTRTADGSHKDRDENVARCPGESCSSKRRDIIRDSRRISLKSGCCRKYSLPRDHGTRFALSMRVQSTKPHSLPEPQVLSQLHAFPLIEGLRISEQPEKPLNEEYAAAIVELAKP